MQGVACGRKELGLDRELGGFPGGDAAGDFTDAVKSTALQQAGGDGRAVATGTIHQQRTVPRQLAEILDQMIKREGQASADVFLFALAGGADVDGERRLSG